MNADLRRKIYKKISENQLNLRHLRSNFGWL